MKLHWRSSKQIPQFEMSQELRSWLLEQKSLTRRLRRRCKGRFEVRLESQCWRRPCLDEARLLGVRLDALTFIRQVHLLCNGEPWVYARTVIPLSTLRGAQRRLIRLGSRPLGDILFANTHNHRRRPIQVAKIPLKSLPRQPARSGSKETLNKSGFLLLPEGEGVNSLSYPLTLTLSQREKELNQSFPKDMDAVWGRRSVFRLQGKPLLVAEFFLPALCR